MFMSEGLRFLVSVSLCVMLFGSVIYYLNTRISTLEKAIVKQNQVLSDFIVNVKSNLMSQPSSFAEMQNTGASEEAISNAKAIYSSSNPSSKIVVPDDDNKVVSVNIDANDDSIDEASDGASDYSSDYSNDDASEVEVEEVNASEVEVEEVNAREVEVEEVNANEVEVEEVNAIEVDVEEVNAIEVDVEEVNASEVEVEEVNSSEQMGAELGEVEPEPSPVKSLNTIEVSEPVKPVMKIIKLEEVDQVNESAALNDEELQKLKVSELKELAKQKGIKHTNLKKPELIKALLAL